MKKINQAEVIFKAFSDTVSKTLPSREEDYPDWFKKRLEKCDKCKYNTKNVPTKYLPVGGLMLGKTLGKHRCTICTCFIKQKCWSKVEECAMGETSARPAFLPEAYVKGNEPNPEVSQWNRLELLTMKSDDFDVRLPEDSPYNVDLTEDGSAFIFKLPAVTQGIPHTFELDFTLLAKKPTQVTTIGSSCGCTVPTLKSTDDKTFDIHVTFNPPVFFKMDGNSRVNVERNIKIHYKEVGKEDEGDVITFLFNAEVKYNPDYVWEPPKPREPEKTDSDGNAEKEPKGGQA